MKRKDVLLALGSVMIIAASALFMWKNYFAAPTINASLHQGIGEALAEETIRYLEDHGDILVITMADRDSDILAAQFAAFRARIEKSGVRIREVQVIDSEKKAKYGPGIGVSASKLTREVKKNTNKAAIVSFVACQSSTTRNLPRFPNLCLRCSRSRATLTSLGRRCSAAGSKLRSFRGSNFPRLDRRRHELPANGSSINIR